jgi:hypothetical protein
VSSAVLRFEREVVDALSTTTDPARRAAVVAWVDGSLAAMPELLRAGVATGSLVLGPWARLTGRHGAALVDALERSPLPPVRLHLRLLRSLVLFGDLELGTETSPR